MPDRTENDYLRTDLFGKQTTCDAKCCDECAYHTSAGLDLCPDHWPMGGKIIGDELEEA